MIEIKLLPCPFCGGEAKTGYAICDYNRWGVYCVDCGAVVEVDDGLEADTEENAIKRWNTRKPMQEICERLELEARLYSLNNRECEFAIRLDKAIKICKEVGGMNAS